MRDPIKEPPNVQINVTVDVHAAILAAVRPICNAEGDEKAWIAKFIPLWTAEVLERSAKALRECHAYKPEVRDA